MSRTLRAVHKDLKRLVRGEVLFDKVSRALYSTDASMFEIKPLGVVRPLDAEDVVNLVRYCHRHRIPITGRGAGSSVAGQAVGQGVVLDFSRFMNRLVEVDSGFARVQPGLVLGELNRRLGAMFFPPDPSSGEFCTLGGMISTNASGTHSLKYGVTRDYVLELEAVLSDGERVTITEQGPAKLYEPIAGLVEKHRDVIERYRPAAPKNSSGYHVWDRPVHLPRLVCGSEGTLCVIVEAKLRVVPRPKKRRLQVYGFDSTDAACARAVELMGQGPSALELIDDTALQCVLQYRPEFGSLIPSGARALLLVEFEDDGPSMPETLWQIRKMISPALERVKGERRSTRLVEDVCVEPSKVAEYVQGLKKILDGYGVRAAIFGHVGSGNIHCNMFLGARETALMKKIADDVTDLVMRLRGTLSGEHGDGLLRAPYLRKFFGDLYPVFERIKEIFDPAGILNPGKKLCRPRYSFLNDFRASRSPGFRVTPGFALLDVLEEAVRCNGCGKCRTYCPVFAEEREEYSLPRAKNNLVVAAARGELGLPGDGRFRGQMERCLACRKCLTECPAGCDLPAIAKALGLRPCGC